MGKGLVLIVVVMVSFSSCKRPALSGVYPSHIYGGTPLAKNEWKSIVALTFDNKTYCSGVLIARDVVATAGHCVAGFSQDQIEEKVRVKVISANYEITKMITHPLFTEAGKIKYDFGLIFLSKKVPATIPIISPLLSSAEAQQIYKSGKKLTLVGFGRTETKKMGEKFIGFSQIKTVTKLDISMAGGPGSTCTGDSGTGIISTLSDGSLRVVGINSRGPRYRDKTCRPYGLFGRITILMEWYHSVMAQENPIQSSKHYIKMIQLNSDSLEGYLGLAKKNPMKYEQRIIQISQRKKNHRLLIDAIVDHNLKRAETILKKNNVDLEFPRHEDARPLLFIAMSEGDISMVKMLIDHGAKVDILDEQGRGVLHHAAEIGDLKMLQFFIPYSLGLSKQEDWNKEDPLSIAIAKNHIEIVDFLLEQKISINQQNYEGYTPLLIAIESGQMNIVDSILERSPRLDITTRQKEGAILLAIKHQHYQLVHDLLRYGANVNETDDKGYSALMNAVIKKNMMVIDDLIVHGADINVMNDQQTNSALTLAVNSGQLDVVKILLEKGADINMTTCYGSSPLFLSIRKDMFLISKLLLENGADPNLSNNEGLTPLLKAVRSRMIDQVRLLIKYGAKINQQDNNGNTALSIADKYGYKEIVDILNNGK